MLISHYANSNSEKCLLYLQFKQSNVHINFIINISITNLSKKYINIDIVISTPKIWIIVSYRNEKYNNIVLHYRKVLLFF